jgi:quercetin dioxygenase-like cupin family protein
MANPGERISNPMMGATIEFRDTAASTSGALVRMEFTLAPRGVIAGEHMHPIQRERFEVLSGRMTGRVAGVDSEVEAGGSSEMKPGVPHCWWNGGEDEARLLVEFRPALKTDEFFEWVFALGRRSLTDAHGVPKSYHRLTVLTRYADEMVPTGLPAPVALALRLRRRLER